MKKFKLQIAKINTAINILNHPPAAMSDAKKTALSRKTSQQIKLLHHDIYSWEMQLGDKFQAACYHDWCDSIVDHIKQKCEICYAIEMEGSR
jgi:hypothetical protein